MERTNNDERVRNYACARTGPIIAWMDMLAPFFSESATELEAS